ncbi:MAG: methyltransferase, partial [Chlorobi bacterium]|nr:methyltransferase [Chlorobiota bacterium]
MGNSWFQFQQFKINQDKTAMKVGVDSVLLGASASFNNPKNILDIGAGTGLLSFMAEQRTNAKITAVEIEYNAFLQCKENILHNKKEKHIEVINISIQKFAQDYIYKFDHIICNPPY